MEKYSPVVLDADWMPTPAFENPRRCSDPIEYHKRVMRRQQRQIERRALRFDRFVRNLFRFAVTFYIIAVTIALLVG